MHIAHAKVVVVAVVVAAEHLLSAMGHLALLLLNFETLQLSNIYSLPFPVVNTNFHFPFSICKRM